MTKPKRSKSPDAKIALCYVRQSMTRDENDTNSPERQKANILLVCQKNGWIPEWYEDAEGHKSGRYVNNRPGWLAMSERFNDPDVVALVANDLSRIHRKGWRVGDLIDHLEQRGIALVAAAPGREIDTSNATGKMFVQFTAMLDEYYAEDISQRAKDSVAYRKSLGKYIGQAPYGTDKKDGYLIPTQAGAWLLGNGRFVAGKPEEPPEEGALWRSYYEGAKRILELYAENKLGLVSIAYQMNVEGYPFRARRSRPRPMTEDDIRRVVSNWDKYGGIVTNERSKDRRAYEEIDPDTIVFNEERAVFPVKLLREVAKIRHERSVRPPDANAGKPREAKFYPLSQLTYCAHCEELAHKHGDSAYRTRLTGTFLNSKPKYRHKLGVDCGCQRKTVPVEVIEGDFERLISLLVVNPDKIDEMAKLAIEVDRTLFKTEGDPEREKQEAIALCKRRIAAAVSLFGDGVIDREEYLRRKEKNERDIAYWQARTTESDKAALELSMCMDVVETMKRLWKITDDEDRQGMVRNLFSYIIYNLDTQRIIGFKLKPWADRFLALREALYEDEGVITEEDVMTQITQRGLPHTGLKNQLRKNPHLAPLVVLEHIFTEPSPKLAQQNAIIARNQEILLRHAQGELGTDLAKEYGLSGQRISQIVYGQ